MGPGNARFLHKLLFDNNGYMAYHAAFHDAFGYLQSFHGIGPGYDYRRVKIFDKTSMFAGQISGILFWRNAMNDLENSHILRCI